MALRTEIVIDDRPVVVELGRTILEACNEHGIHLPVMCHFDGLRDVGACRLCLVEIEGGPRLFPACTTRVAENQRIRTRSEKLDRYRRMIVELFFAERNHVCAVCVANGHCELQDLAAAVGMDHVRFPYLFPACEVDASHPRFVMDHNRCILCTRCVRVCAEVEGAWNWDVMGRGVGSRIIADFNQPWGESTTCTSCGKCVELCPTGALWPKQVSQGDLARNRAPVRDLIARRGRAL